MPTGIPIKIVTTGGIPITAGVAGSGTPVIPDLYWGALIPQLWSLSGQQTFNGQAGKAQALADIGTAWYDSGVARAFDSTTLTNMRNAGYIPVYDWYSEDSNGTGFSNASVTSGTYDSYLNTWFTAAAAWGHPFFLRFDSEMNGSWRSFCDQTSPNTVGSFVTMWKHVHDRAVANGATNITWVWCTAIKASGGDLSLANYYPGDTYVDWLSFDAYNFYNPTISAPWCTWEQSSQGSQDGNPTTANTYGLLQAINATKPIMVAETGSLERNPGDKGAWITDMLSYVLTSQPQIRAIRWYNIQDDANHDYRITTSTSAQNAFEAGIANARYVTNIWSGISKTPIPAPQL